MDFSTIDITIFALYAVLILSIGLFVSRQKKGETKSAEDYFLAGISKLEGNQDDPKGIVLTKKLFATGKTFNVAAFGVLLITVLLYALFW